MTEPMETASNTLRIMYAAAEADPIIKVGGLGDVTGSLPCALRELDPALAMGCRLDIRLVLPFHPLIAKSAPARGLSIEPVVSFHVPRPGGAVAAQAFLTHVGDLPVYLIAGDPISKDGPVYNIETRKDGEKYTFFSLAVLELARALNWPPHILHANDWHTAIASYALHLRRAEDPFLNDTRSILSVHNLPYMGAGTEDALAAYAIPPLRDDRLPPWGSYQPLPMGLAAADHITTVSPTYASEILTSGFGCGLQDFLQMRAGSITGILNGMDENFWNQATDPALAANFDADTLGRRAVNKQALLEEFGLHPDLNSPLLVMVGRMDRQKGVDQAVEALRQVSSLAWQAILLGSGDPTLENMARQLEAEYPDRVRAVIRFDVRLARRLYAGGDMLLMPSRYEPCGIAQMIAMRYGCLPVARSTGGLRDTIQDTRIPETSTGFLYEESTPEALAAALRRALAAKANQAGWPVMQHFGMQQDFSWPRSAQLYAQIYHKLSL